MDEDPRELNHYFDHVHSGSYRPDPAFLNDLHKLDPDLEPRWSARKQRWEIYRWDKYIMTVQTVKGDYCPLDNRVLQKLFVIDTNRYKNKFDFIRTLHLEDEHLMKMKRHEQDEFIRACHRDAKPFLIGRKTVSANSEKVKEQEKQANDRAKTR